MPDFAPGDLARPLGLRGRMPVALILALVASLGLHVVALFGLVRLAHADARLEDVLPYLHDYLALDPIKHEVRFTLAGCLVNLGRHAEAGNELDQILLQDPANAAARELAEELKRIAA